MLLAIKGRENSYEKKEATWAVAAGWNSLKWEWVSEVECYGVGDLD
jgi:hypothetical protein